MNDALKPPPLEGDMFAPPEGARASVVNRTRRVVHDQALRMQAERIRSRGLWVPLAICSALLLVICYAIWAVMAGYDLSPTSVPDRCFCCCCSGRFPWPRWPLY